MTSWGAREEKHTPGPPPQTARRPRFNSPRCSAGLVQAEVPPREPEARISLTKPRNDRSRGCCATIPRRRAFEIAAGTEGVPACHRESRSKRIARGLAQIVRNAGPARFKMAAPARHCRHQIFQGDPRDGADGGTEQSAAVPAAAARTRRREQSKLATSITKRIAMLKPTSTTWGG